MAKMVPVVSSMVVAIGWNPETLKLTAQFGDQFYEYDNVPADVAATVIFSESIGSTFNTLIKKGGFNYRKITSDQASA
jgi:hypothetical protein